MSTTDATYRKEIRYDRATKDFRATLDGNYIGHFGSYHAAEVALDQVAYDLLMDGQCATAAELDGGSDADTMAEEVAAAVVAPNPGVHLNQYTVVLSQPDQTFCYEIKTLCDACRATTPNASKMGEVINACCDACGVGPSVSHFRLEAAPEQLPADWMRMPEGDILDADGMRVSLPSSLCPECQGSGWVPAGGWGDQAGGWAETCPDCGGQAARQRCLLCGGDHSAENCPRIHPIDATALLEEADAVIGRLYCPNCLGNHLLQDCPLKRGDHTTEVDVLLTQIASHPGPDCSCPDCTRAAERLIIDAFMTRLRFDAGVLCSFCGDEHADSACPQKRPLLAPRVCGNCGGQHSIQQCSDIRRLLFAA